jgi:23S rRNA-/tRNA-specific pseudouridylate synthase
MIPILYEEPHFMLVNKPAGLLTQAVVGVDCLQKRLVQQIKLRDGNSGQPFVGLPHRLDRGTSGVLLVARNQLALRRFGDQFHHRQLQKYYVAWFSGDLPCGVLHWQDWIRKVDQEARAEILPADTPGARLAEMRILKLASSEKGCLGLIQILTGRMHQIRLQLASRRLPVVGDVLYGSQVSFSPLAKDADPRVAPLALHALRLEYRHPQSAIRLSATAPFSEYFTDLCPVIAQACQGIYQLSLQTVQQQWKIDQMAVRS